jgi:hypothetical protein
MKVFRKLPNGTRVPMIQVRKDNQMVYVDAANATDAIDGDPLEPSVTSWRSVRNLWAEAQEFLTTIASRVTDDPITPEVLAARRKACFGDETQKKCGKLNEWGGHFYCGACGCGHNPLAILDGGDGEYTKLHYPKLKCPLKKF